MNVRIVWIACALAVVTLVACSGEKTYCWEEAVVLSTGERLTLDRTVRLEKVSAAFNPFKSEWAWRESTITVRAGPADLKGARYEARLLPMLIERDLQTQQLVVVGINVYCDDRSSFNPEPGQRYFAFFLPNKSAMRQVPIPTWAWERRLNLLMPNEEKSPPRQVTPEFADRFNRTESRGEPHYFVIDPSIKSKC